MKLSIAIIDYGLGNIQSAKKSIEKVILDNNVEGDVYFASDFKLLEKSTHIILPGQGAFESCIKGLKNLEGMIDELNKQIIYKKKPILGICVGMQLLANRSFENGINEGLGWIEGSIEKVPNGKLSLPHMGWNDLTKQSSHKVLDNINNDDHFYFVHSYYFKTINNENIIATANYGINFPAIVAKENILGVQFHPEKSSSSGLKMLTNFINI
tara:strand:+ start:8787 stop:9422 length:636 start_codon:yes stop_codon:yes gene_type:complete